MHHPTPFPSDLNLFQLTVTTGHQQATGITPGESDPHLLHIRHAPLPTQIPKFESKVPPGSLSDETDSEDFRGQVPPPNVGSAGRLAAAGPRWPASPAPPPELYITVPGGGGNIITPNRLRSTQTPIDPQFDLFGLSPPTSLAAPTQPPPRRDQAGELDSPAFGSFLRFAEILDLQPTEVELGQKVLVEVSGL